MLVEERVMYGGWYLHHLFDNVYTVLFGDRSRCRPSVRLDIRRSVYVAAAGFLSADSCTVIALYVHIQKNRQCVCERDFGRLPELLDNCRRLGDAVWRLRFMRDVYVSFSKVMDVKRFIEQISPFDGHFDLIDGMYIVDAKSLMGILAMDLTKPIKLRIERDNRKTMKAIVDFIVDAPESVSPTTVSPVPEKV